MGESESRRGRRGSKGLAVGSVDEKVDGSVDGWVDGYIDGWEDRWVEMWVVGRWKWQWGHRNGSVAMT